MFWKAASRTGSGFSDGFIITCDFTGECRPAFYHQHQFAGFGLEYSPPAPRRRSAIKDFAERALPFIFIEQRRIGPPKSTVFAVISTCAAGKSLSPVIDCYRFLFW
ncbi:hypothetical protein KCP73_12350 [Salmonella enterica subsp. enterica]|nr:hypothetical protein KCP73_12350 [Salmonella enterica subsp. enterica]